MKLNTRLFFLHARTSIHVGSGRGTGAIDLPIARQKSTGLPVIPSTGIKGVWRDAASKWNLEPQQVAALYGPAQDNKDQGEGRGMLSPQDARLLALPVASMTGGWLWVSSPFLLSWLKREARACLPNSSLPDRLPDPKDDDVCLADESIAFNVGEDRYVVLHDQVLKTAKMKGNTELVKDWARYISSLVFEPLDDWRKIFVQRFAVVSDEAMHYFSQYATEDQARVTLDENRVAVGTGLWREESLPMETILFGVVGTEYRKNSCYENDEDLLNAIPVLCDLQIGGKASTGKGIVSMRCVRPK